MWQEDGGTHICWFICWSNYCFLLLFIKTHNFPKGFDDDQKTTIKALCFVSEGPRFEPYRIPDPHCACLLSLPFRSFNEDRPFDLWSKGGAAHLK